MQRNRYIPSFGAFSVSALFALSTGLLCGAEARAASPKTLDRDVRVGAYVADIQDLDLKSHTYTVDLYLWFRWKNCELDPAETMEFMNAYDLWGHTRKKEFSHPNQIAGGECYQVIRNQGKFSQKLLLDDYPFDHQTLVIEFEDSSVEHDKLVFVADSEGIQLSPRVSLPGFRIGTPRLSVADFEYSSTFGLADVDGKAKYSRVRIEIPLVRPVVAYGLKLLLPILCVVFCATLMFLFHPKYVDVRVGIGITALLTIVALQITLNEDLPEIGYLILMDKIYLCAYVFVILGLGLICKSTRLFDLGSERQARRVDKLSLVLLPALYLVAMSFVFLQSFLSDSGI